MLSINELLDSKAPAGAEGQVISTCTWTRLPCDPGNLSFGWSRVFLISRVFLSLTHIKKWPALDTYGWLAVAKILALCTQVPNRNTETEFWRKEKLYLLARQSTRTGSCLEKLYPHLEKTVRSFIAMVQRGCDQLRDILLMGRWWGKQESASSTFRSNWSGVYMLAGRTPLLILHFSHLEGASVSTEYLKDIMHILFWSTRTFLLTICFSRLLSFPFPN